MIAEKNFITTQTLITGVRRQSETGEALKILNLSFPRPVIVVVGGADEANGYDTIRKAAGVVAAAAEQNKAIVISGGTDSGVMAAIGQARAQGNHHFPLVGVAVENLVTGLNPAQKNSAPLEPHHTHFFLVPGNEWGDESGWIAHLAATLAWEQPSITILSNGGDISLKDVVYSLKCKRPVVVLKGTGRLADDLAHLFTSSDLIKIVPVQDEAAIFETINTYLLRKERRL